VPAAAVIPSLSAFSYVVAAKELVAASRRKLCPLEKISTFKVEQSMYSPAREGIGPGVASWAT